MVADHELSDTNDSVSAAVFFVVKTPAGKPVLERDEVISTRHGSQIREEYRISYRDEWSDTVEDSIILGLIHVFRFHLGHGFFCYSALHIRYTEIGAL